MVLLGHLGYLELRLAPSLGRLEGLLGLLGILAVPLALGLAVLQLCLYAVVGLKRHPLWTCACPLACIGRQHVCAG